jgi:mono/diheme cytochrome c family protein
MRLGPVIVGLLFAFASTAATNPLPVTFTKDVAPVLQKNCQGCHRPGEAAPTPGAVPEFLKPEECRRWHAFHAA